MRWSVTLEAEGDLVLTREEVVELADAVATCNGIASGIGTTRYGATLLVDADGRHEAIDLGTERFALAVAQAGLPNWPVVRIEAQSEADADDEIDEAE